MIRSTKTWLMAAALLGLTACAGPEIRRPRGCEERLANPEHRAACMACVERPMPHAYFPDRPEGERCVRQ